MKLTSRQATAQTFRSDTARKKTEEGGDCNAGRLVLTHSQCGSKTPWWQRRQESVVSGKLEGPDASPAHDERLLQGNKSGRKGFAARQV
jgi:hypothetical protein